MVEGKPAHMVATSDGITRAGLNDDMNDSYSSAAMSIRAEQILANAKKRLTVSYYQRTTPLLKAADLL